MTAPPFEWVHLPQMPKLVSELNCTGVQEKSFIKKRKRITGLAGFGFQHTYWGLTAPPKVCWNHNFRKKRKRIALLQSDSLVGSEENLGKGHRKI